MKLKKVGEQDLIHNTEYELTPYEVTWKARQQARKVRDTGNLRSAAFGQMLLDDIRSRRYKLNKVMINGDLPLRLKKDAHELILDFIRSRPPLVPVSKRVLKPPPKKEETLYERLMDSIRQEHKLRPTPRPESTFHSFSANTTPLPRHRSGKCLFFLKFFLIKMILFKCLIVAMCTQQQKVSACTLSSENGQIKFQWSSNDKQTTVYGDTVYGEEVYLLAVN